MRQPDLMRTLGLLPPLEPVRIKPGKKEATNADTVSSKNPQPKKRTGFQPHARHQHLHSRSIILKREEIYSKVWNQAAMHVAKEYGISGSMLARICTELNVPRPPRGYWARSTAARRGLKKHLPKLKEGAPDFWAVNPVNVKSQRRKVSR